MYDLNRCKIKRLLLLHSNQCSCANSNMPTVFFYTWPLISWWLKVKLKESKLKFAFQQVNMWKKVLVYSYLLSFYFYERINNFNMRKNNKYMTLYVYIFWNSNYSILSFFLILTCWKAKLSDYMCQSNAQWLIFFESNSKWLHLVFRQLFFNVNNIKVVRLHDIDSNITIIRYCY